MVHSIYFIIAVQCIVTVVGIVVVRALIHFILPKLAWIGSPKNFRERVLVRYQGKDFGAWMFAWFKTGLDEMFVELPEFLKSAPPIHTFLDLGCGFGVAGCFLLELFPQAQAYAIDPSANRVKGAAAAMGDRGHVFQAAAPDFERSEFPDHFDAVFALDMIHFLPDAALDLTLQRIRARLNDGDYLVIRSPVKPTGPGSLKQKLAQVYSFVSSTHWDLRTVEEIRQRITNVGFDVTISKLSGTNPELFWFIATASATVVKPDSGDQQREDNRMADNQPSSIHTKEFVHLLQPTDPA